MSGTVIEGIDGDFFAILRHRVVVERCVNLTVPDRVVGGRDGPNELKNRNIPLVFVLG